MRVAAILLALLCNYNKINGSTLTSTPVTEVIKGFIKILDSSCGYILHTAEQLQHNRTFITKVALGFAGDFNNDLFIAAMEFKAFIKYFKTQAKIFACKMPVLIILFDDEQTRQELSNITSFLPLHDFVTLIFTNKLLQQWFEGISTPFSAFIVVAQEINPTFISLLEVYRVHPEFPLRSPVLGNWTSHHGLIIHEDNSNVYNRRHDLEGIVLRIGSLENPPLHSFEPQQNGENDLVGYFPEVWKELEKILNFSSIYFPSADNAAGIKEENGNWNGLIGMILRNEIDVALSAFIMDIHRSNVVEFTRPLLKSNYQIYFKARGTAYNWDAVLRPFGTDSWVALLAWTIVASFFLTASFKIYSAYVVEPSTRHFNLNLLNSFFFHLQAICSQGCSIVPESLACRILFLSAYLVNCVLSPCYSAYLISYITFHIPNRPFDNLQGFLDDPSYKLITIANTAEYAYFTSTNDELLHSIYMQKMIKDVKKLPITAEQALNRVCEDSQIVFFGDSMVSKPISLHAKLYKECDIMTLSRSISEIYSSMIVRKHNPYRMAISHFLQKMEDSGVIDRALLKNIPQEKDTITSSNLVEVKDVLQTFLLLIVGMIFSITILSCEIFFYRRTCRRTKHFLH